MEAASLGSELCICRDNSVSQSDTINDNLNLNYLTLTVGRMLSGVAYWYLRFQLFPFLRGCRVEKEVVVLDDGTTVTKFVELPFGRFNPTSTINE